ncbi:hypothetical protein [Variovorax sp. PAMC26660]|uniref:hypothetical protein n=1 Tax=Variovorax sp. PAMC26660 TaxID=2762322 RepID=UPI00164E1575|nr:hypothetical protein [Variovorax sp. PAMC26660]QNK68691.1 hypothetical protein H7F35_02805 [Variovorax sp. PAMC26660]
MAFEKYLLPMALLVSALVASAAQPTAGLIEVRPDGRRTVFTTERLSRNDHIVAQHAQAQGGAKCCVSLRITGMQRRRTDVSDELKGRQVRAYALPPLKTADAVPFVGGALVFKAGERDSVAAERALLGGAADKTIPQFCTSSEGAHLLQLGGGGEPQAHLYMHFSYDVEPTCNEALLERLSEAGALK